MVVFDDMHWGEPTFLDLVEHVADLSRDAPILLLCMARPELLDVRPAWGGGKLNATNVLLEPLAPEETARAGRACSRTGRRAGPARAGSSRPPAETRSSSRRCSRWCRGAAATSRCRRRSRRCSPPASTSSTAAERGVLERGAVEGQVFHRGAVAALAPAATRRRRPAGRARAQGARSARDAAAAGRRRLPVPPPADPRRRLRGAAEGDARRAARALRRLARGARRARWSSSTRSSATTSSRRTATEPSSARSTTRGRARRAGRRAPARERRPRARPRAAPGGDGKLLGRATRAPAGGRSEARRLDWNW